MYPVMPNIQMTTLPGPDHRSGPPLLRETLGTVLRGLRGESGRTLRDVADAARHGLQQRRRPLRRARLVARDVVADGRHMEFLLLLRGLGPCALFSS